MTVDITNNLISFNGKEVEFLESVEKLASLSSFQFNNFFLNREKKVPRKINIMALRSVLNDKVVHSKEIELSDEQRYRLLSYPSFCETQLQNFMKIVCDEELVNEYYKNLWKLILINIEAIDMVDGEISYLLNLPVDDVKTNYESFLNDTFNSFSDIPGDFDGLSKSDFRAVTNKSSTLVELREIGAKYNLNIPRRLKKEELQAIIVEELKDMGKYDDETAETLNIMSVLTMQRFAKKNGIKVSIELKKEELVEYVLKQAEKADLNKSDKNINIVELPNQEAFDFKEEYVVDEIIDVEAPVVVLPTEEAPVEVEETPVAEPVVEETPVEEAPVEEVQVEEAPEAPVQNLTENTEPAAVKTIYVQTPVQATAGIDAETLKTIIKETVTEVVASTKKEEPKGMSAEEVKALVREVTSNQVPATQSNQSPVTSEDIRYLVEGTVRQVVTQIMDKIPQPTAYVQTPISADGETVRSYQTPEEDYTSFAYTTNNNMQNKLFDENMANKMNASTTAKEEKAVEETDEPTMVDLKAEKSEEKKAQKKAKVDEKKAKEKADLLKKGKFKALNKKGAEVNDSDVNMIKNQTALLEYQEALNRNKMIKKQKGKKRFWTFILVILLILILYFVLLFVNQMAPNIAGISDACSFLEKNTGPVYSVPNSWAEALKGVFKK